MAAGERRVVSVLIADVADSTSIGEQLGPERSKFLFDEVVRLMRQEVERFDGLVAQLTGDGVLALFGVPAAHENDSERAVRAALAIHESLARYAAEIGPAYGFQLRARVAVNTGPVVVPTGDAPPYELYNALGDTVNVAARLQAFGELVVGPTTAAAVGGIVVLDHLGALELKGKAKLVDAYRVSGIREEPAARPHPQLVGRAEELAALTGAIEGGGAVISITGEPGIGKSRLVAEAAARLDGRVRLLAGRSGPYTSSIPYWPVRSLLRAWLGLGVSEPEARLQLELRAGLARTLGAAAEHAYAFIATLLGVALEPEVDRRMRDLAGDAVRYETFDWMYRLLSALAHEQPLCLVFEDLHWSDEATIALLDELLPAVEDEALAFVLVHRSDPDHPAWRLVDRARRRFPHRSLELALSPLSARAGRELAEGEAQGELPEELVRLLEERAGGNPYFVVEAIRDLRERGSLERRGGRLELVGDVTVPAALQEALQARIDRLDPEARAVLTTASVIGHTFALPLLERVLPQLRLRPSLSELQWLELVEEERGGPGPEYRFRHGLVQEVAYGTLLEPRRRELHRLVGEALLELHRESPAEAYGLLAHHFAAAAESERAVEFLLAAGDAARTAYANDEAIELYRRALSSMVELPDDGRQRHTLLRIGLSHHLAFDFGSAAAAFSEAFARAAPPPVRLTPTESVTWVMPAAWDRIAVPSHSWTKPAWEIGANLFRGLLAIGPDLEIVPDLAESFTVSDDGHSYTFRIRTDATWSDGEPVTAADVAFAWQRLIGEGAVGAFWLEGIVAEATGERTLELRIDEPRNYLLHLLTVPPLVPWPRHVVEREGPEWHRQVPLVGNGPFVLTSVGSDHVVLEAAEAWYGDRGNVLEVTVVLAAPGSALRGAWRRGRYDVLDDTLSVAASDDKQTRIERSPGMQTWYLGFDAIRPPLDDPRLRRAIAHAIDRQAVAGAMVWNATDTGGLIPPQIPGHSQRVAPPLDRDRARALLAEAGDPGEIVLAGLDLWEPATAEIGAQLRTLGMRVQMRTFESDPELASALGDPVSAYVWAWGADFPDPGGGVLEAILRDLPLYRDEQLLRLLERARSFTDRDERLRLYREFERIWIGEQAAVVPLGYQDRLFWRRPWIHGLWANTVAMSTFASANVDRSVALVDRA